MPGNPPSSPRNPASTGGPRGASSTQHPAQAWVGSWAGPHTHTWPLPGAPLAADHPQSPAPSLSAPALPAGVCLVPGKVSGSQTLQGLGFRKCNDFMHFQSNLRTPKVMLYLRRASHSGLTHEVNSASKNFTASFQDEPICPGIYAHMLGSAGKRPGWRTAALLCCWSCEPRTFISHLNRKTLLLSTLHE